jgi:hypothetical protein
MIFFVQQTCVDRGLNGPEEGYDVKPTPTPDATREAYAAGFAGTWDTNWGVMTCLVQGQRVDCTYTYDEGNIHAYVNQTGLTMDGTWSEAPSYASPEDGGRVTFSISGDDSTIYGTWWYGENGEGGTWTGTRIP